MTTKRRRVFGRRRVEIGDAQWLIEMRADCLRFRRKHARQTTEVPLAHVVEQLAIGQKLLPL